MGIGSKIKDAKRIFSQDGSFEAVNSRISNLETHEYKITYYEVVSGTSGTLTVPSQGTINADEFGLSGNAILSKIDVNGKPTFESPVTSGGSPVTASLNVLTGAWVASAAYTDTNVALIYSIKINALYYDNLVYSNIIETVKVTADVGTTTLQSVTDAGNTTTNTIETAGYVKTGGTSSQFLKADGTVDSSVYITSSALTPYLTTASAALTYYPLTNPNGYITGITSGMVTTALGYTPYNATNPSGFITSSALTPYLTINDAALTYFPIPTGTTSQYVRGDGTLASFPTIPSITGLVPYTGATANVDLGTHSLTARDLIINHASGSGVAASITKGGSGEALTVVKSSGSGNVASFTGGVTLISELHLTTDLADTYIASAATWNAKQDALSGTGFVKSTAGVISYDTNTYLTTTSAASTYVPYTGATGNVDLGANSLIATLVNSNTIAGPNTSGGNLLILSTNNATKGSITIGNNNSEIIYLGNQQFGFTNVWLYGASNANSFLISRVTASDTLPVYVTNRSDQTTGIGGVLNKVALIANGLTRFSVNGLTTSGATTSFSLTKPDNTNQTLSTSIAGWSYNGGTRQWATGAITSQSENVWGATTYSFVGASTITNAYGNVFNAPIAGTNATITNNWAALFNDKINVALGVSTFRNSAQAYIGLNSDFSNGDYPGIWFNQTNRTVNNYAFLADGPNTIFNAPSTGTLWFRINNSTKLKVNDNGNISIQNGGTHTDAGFRLDVNGTGRFQNTLRVTNNLIAGFNTTPRTGTISDGVTSILGNLQNFTTNYHSGEVLYSEVSGEALNFGQLCYRDAAGKWQRATGSSSTIAAYNMLGICLQTVGATDTAISILTRGYVESTYLSAGAVGNPLFMDATTAGSITNTAPSTAGNVVRVIGNVFWSSALQTNSKWIVYFNPDNTWIEL